MQMCSRTHHFRSGAKYAELAEADMEGRAREGAVRLLDDDDVDRTSESRGVDLVVEETEVADDLGDIVHAVHVLTPRTAGRGTRPTMARREGAHRAGVAVRNSRRGEREMIFAAVFSPKVSRVRQRERKRERQRREEPRRSRLFHARCSCTKSRRPVDGSPSDSLEPDDTVTTKLGRGPPTTPSRRRRAVKSA